MATPSQKPPKRKLTGTSPPNRKTKGGKNSEMDCLICEKPILEASDHCEGEEAVFCEGSCQGWIHRICTGVTRPAFEKLGEPDTQYLCSHCMLISQSKEINKLANIIKHLNANVISLTETITSLQSYVTSHPTAPEQSGNAEIIVTATNKSNQENLQQDCKFNVVVYGIDECPKGTPRHEHSGLDLSNVAKTITKVDENVNPLSIPDLRRLGKYQELSSRP